LQRNKKYFLWTSHYNMVFMRARNMYFDTLKLFTIFLVIWGHCIQHFQTNDLAENVVFRYISSFHMSLFMMISGYFSVSSLQISIFPFITKKFMRLIYPCIVWGGMLWIILEVTHSFHYGNGNISFVGLLSDFYWMSDFWFLKSCFICYCLAYIGVHSRVKVVYWVPITLLLSLLIPLFQVTYMFPCFLLGWFLRNNKKLTNWILTNTHYFVIFFLVMLIFWNQNTWNKSHCSPSIHGTDYIIVLIESLYSRVYRLLIGIVGSVTVLSVFQYLFKVKVSFPKYIDACCQMGVYTLEIYIIHSIMYVWFLKFIINLDNIGFIYYTFIITPICSVFTLILCFYFAKITHRSPLISHFLWGKA
jgi:fucose 4-O-acetylase-like acetyltransferase